MQVIDLIHEKVKDGYKIFIEQYEDGRTYRLSKRIDETAKTNCATISAKIAAMLVAKYGPNVHAEKTEYFGKREEHVEGDNVILYYNINEQKLN